MKATTKKALKIIISIIYIIWGIAAPLTAFKAILALDLGAIASAVVGVMMLLAGIFGLMGVKKLKCRLFGIVIFICALIAVVVALPVINWASIITALLAWLYIVCL